MHSLSTCSKKTLCIVNQSNEWARWKMHLPAIKSRDESGLMKANLPGKQTQ